MRKQMYHMLERGVPNEGYAPLFVFSVFDAGYVEFLSCYGMTHAISICFPSNRGCLGKQLVSPVNLTCFASQFNLFCQPKQVDFISRFRMVSNVYESGRLPMALCYGFLDFEI